MTRTMYTKSAHHFSIFLKINVNLFFIAGVKIVHSQFYLFLIFRIITKR